MNQVMKLIGIGAQGKESLLPIYENWIYNSELLIGGERLLQMFPDYNGEKIVVKGKLANLIEKLQGETRTTVILASGDPLFFGIGKRLASELSVEIYPHISSIQLAFAKMQESWDNAYFTSVHGRQLKGLVQRIDGRDKIVILTDKLNTPAKIADYLLSFQMFEYKAFVAEDAGSKDSRYRWLTLAEMSKESYSPLNLVILKREEKGPVWSLGIDDEEFFQRKPDKGLITKKEIRVLSVSSLNLKKDSIVWDIGTCTGAVAIECAKIVTEGAVFAIEKSIADLENCYKNLSKFRTDITVVNGKAPEGLENFPDPDAVFIGGTSGEMATILDICCARIRENGRIVVNAVTIETLHDALEVFRNKRFEVMITLAQISKSKPVLHLTRFEALSPIYIITAIRKKG